MVEDRQIVTRHLARRVSRAESAADSQDVVRTTRCLADFRACRAFNEVRNAFYAEQSLDPLPAGTCVEARLFRPEPLVEIAAIAIMSQNRSK